MLPNAKCLGTCILCLTAVLSWPFLSSCTIVRHDASSGSANAVSVTADGSFDAKSFVAQNWNTRIVPELVKNAADIKEVITVLAKDSAAAEKQFGRRQEETAPFNYIVKGRASVVSMNTESSAGYAELNLADVSGSAKVRLQMGPVFKGSAIRDSLSFIKFGDFVNQIDFANISREINFYVRDHVVADTGKSSMAGKTIEFIGAFAEDSDGAVSLTPVQIEIVK